MTALPLKFLKGLLLSIVCAAGLPAYAQLEIISGPSQVTVNEAVPDAYAPPGDFTPDGYVGSKALGGAKWAAINVFTNQTGLAAVFLSGTTATGTFANCSSVVPRWTMTVTRDGILFAGLSSNVWNLVEARSCGFAFTLPRIQGYDVLTPGVYEYRMSQPATGPDVVASVTVRACAAPLSVLWSYNQAYTDNFYTISDAELSASMQAPHFYMFRGSPFKVSRSNEKTAPWMRFFKGPPQIDHFYSHLPAEADYIRPLGWVFERVEGHVFPDPQAGTVPLYRLSQFNGNTGSLEHWYTTDSSLASAYSLYYGWGADGVKGYVCP